MPAAIKAKTIELLPGRSRNANTGDFQPGGLQKNGRIVSQQPCVVVAIFRMEYGQIQLVFNKVMNSVLEGARLELFLVVDHTPSNLDRSCSA